MLKTVAELIAQAQQQIDCVDVARAKTLYDQTDNAVILDVREAAEAAESKLQDSVNVARGLIEMKLPTLCPDPDTVILTHCAGGGRASLSAATLKHMGYTRVFAIVAPFDEIKRAFG